MLMAVLLCVLALVVDHYLGEPRKAHPLVAFGWLAGRLERLVNPSARTDSNAQGQIGRGALAVLVLVLPPTLLALWVSHWLVGPVLWVVELIVLYFALGRRSLRDHARAVVLPLQAGELDVARDALARMVSRDVAALDENGISRAATESVLENGSDAVVASLFWFLLAGIPGVILHRLVNTLDAMWGYRNPRFRGFGRFVAKLDDALAYWPARLTALAYTVSGKIRPALGCWRTQAAQWDSPNAGPVMASGAGALKLGLGGPTPYHGQWQDRPRLGVWAVNGPSVSTDSALRALRLLDRALMIILALAFGGAALWHWSMVGA
ncbi:adenosylcobinamide-phosphate synthase [Natronospira proteinivora]|uniref:Cobalamin biosynthesis protein CobD n=1 Tax=Natronospira proteinivora TaxID=1807133 RepID=A0ABT1G6B8_9GAMM|nr:adenosylcobinamide-phosphate synthase CbiB [Natronospira proteinivora]MCP1726834.1 adenosylcobinamide-phosphate synthase [Natronospira proteinivora]